MKFLALSSLLLVAIYAQTTATQISPEEKPYEFGGGLKKRLDDLPAPMRVFAKHIAIPSIKNSFKQLMAQNKEEKIKAKQAKARVKAQMIEKLKQKKAKDLQRKKQIQLSLQNAPPLPPASKPLSIQPVTPVPPAQE